MLVPALLFGTAIEVRANVNKMITRLLRGASMEEICEAAPKVDLAANPESFLWLDGVWVLRPAAARDFRAVLLTNGLFEVERVPFERSNAIREESVAYLSRSPWGTVVLNSGQGQAWQVASPLRPLRASRRGYVALLEATVRYWDALTALGARYYRGGAAPRTFPEALPAYGGALATLGLEPKGEGTRWRDVRMLCNEALVERLAHDDVYWNDLDRRWKLEAGTPDLTQENVEEIARLCARGSWDVDQWAFLRAERGAEGVERALDALSSAGDLSKHIGVLIHGLRDWTRAARLYMQHERTAEQVHWAGALIAQHLEATSPAEAAEIFVQVAHRGVGGTTKGTRSSVVEALRRARAGLFAAGLEARWRERLHSFLSTHGRRRTLLAAIGDAFPEASRSRG